MSKLQPTQIDYPRNSGVLRWRRSLLPVQKSRMCSLQKSNKQLHFQVYDLPRRSHKIIRIDLGMDPLNACLWKREHYVIFRSDRVCHYVSCLPVTPTTRLEYTLFARIHSSGRWAKMGKVLLVSETTHRRPEQKEVNVLKRTSNKIWGRLNGFLCSYATRNAIMVRIHKTTLLKRWAATGRVQLDSEKLAAKVRGERITKKAQGIRSNQHCRIAEKTLRQKVRRSTDSYALMRREMLLCMLVCDAMLSCNETSSKRLQPSLLARRHYCLTLEVDL
jgi:hypothetical protein